MEAKQEARLLGILVCALLVIGTILFVAQDKGCRGERIYEAAFLSKVPSREAEAEEINSCIDSRRGMVGVAGVVLAGATGGVVTGMRRLRAERS